MGNRKRQSALALKETKKLLAFAKLNNCPTSPIQCGEIINIDSGQRLAWQTPDIINTKE